MTKLILASASKSRAQLLKNAGLDFEIMPADVDEDAIRQALESDKGQDKLESADIAEILARAKAQDVSARAGDALVIGADQILALNDEIFTKPADLEAARAHLLKLKGQTHQLYSAIVVAQNNEVIWHHVARADMTMRDYSPEFVGQYLAQVGEQVCSSVGAYQLEGPGIQLFEKIEGSYFTILGLPLLPLLGFLRSQDYIAN